MNKKVLITGGTGLIGKETISFLEKYGYDEIYALTRANRTDTNKITYIKANLFDKSSVDSFLKEIKPQYLMHCAWLCTGFFSDNGNFDFLSSTIDLLQSFAKNGGKRVVMVGTCYEYGNYVENITETMPTRPINVYSQCKDYAHKISEYYCKLNNISFGWARIFSAFGVETDARRLTLDVIKHLSENKPIIIQSGNLIRDSIYAKDVGEALVKFLSSNIEGTVNICTGKAISIHDFVMIIAKMMNKENLVVFKEQKTASPKKVVGDPSRLKNEIGFVPKYTVEQGLKEVLEVYQK